ncbi:MAG: hypothetical protein ACLFO1_09060 [Spirochaetaceae bacterium]
MDVAGVQSAYVAARQVPQLNEIRLTNFYPLYDGTNDQVDRVLPVRHTIFQRVIPRYELSTSETRDQGVGPTFIEVPGISWSSARPAEAEAGGLPRRAPSRPMTPPGPERAPLPDYAGRRIDLLV